jgi:hypothetical protein
MCMGIAGRCRGVGIVYASHEIRSCDRYSCIGAGCECQEKMIATHGFSLGRLSERHSVCCQY